MPSAVTSYNKSLNMKHKKVSATEITKFFESEPELLNGKADEKMVEMYQAKQYEISDKSMFAGISDEEGHLMAIFRADVKSPAEIDLHIYVRIRFNNDKMYRAICELIYKEVFAKSNVGKVLVRGIPQAYKEARKFIQKHFHHDIEKDLHKIARKGAKKAKKIGKKIIEGLK